MQKNVLLLRSVDANQIELSQTPEPIHPRASGMDPTD